MSGNAVAPSIISRTMSAWPAWRAVSEIRCSNTQRTDHASTSAGNHGTPLGTGLVVVHPGAVLRIADNASLTGISGLKVFSNLTALGVIGLDNGFTPNATINNAFGSPYGAILGMNTQFFAGAIDQTAPIGSPRSNQVVSARKYSSATTTVLLNPW